VGRERIRWNLPLGMVVSSYWGRRVNVDAGQAAE